MFTNDILVTFFSVRCVWVFVRALDNVGGGILQVLPSPHRWHLHEVHAFSVAANARPYICAAGRPLWRRGFISVICSNDAPIRGNGVELQEYGTPLQQ